MTTPKDIEKDLRYLQLLAHSFPTIADASTEIINLQAILNLPKGTEHFLADIHGEYEAFQHVIKNASGNIKRKVNDLFGIGLPESDEYMTVGGYILHEYQSFPKLNEMVKIGHWEFKIIKNTATKIELVKLKVNNKETF